MLVAQRLYLALLALLYPARCSSCDGPCEEGAAFCELCGISLEAIAVACPRCGFPSESDGAARAGPCLACLKRAPPFRTAEAPFLFGGALARAVRRLKWGRQPELGRPLGALLPKRLLEAADLVVPVPLHPRRLRAREFNQSALLAIEVARRRRPVDLRALERTRDTPPQSALGVAERRRNVRGAFRARRSSVEGRRVLLVDDVFTTGATCEACTLALLEAGAAEVAVLTLARAMP